MIDGVIGEIGIIMMTIIGPGRVIIGMSGEIGIGIDEGVGTDSEVRIHLGLASGRMGMDTVMVESQASRRKKKHAMTLKKRKESKSGVFQAFL